MRVHAIDANGTDPTPAVRSFTVDTVAPTVSITAAPTDPHPSSTATVEFTSEAEATFECRKLFGDATDAAAVPCTSPWVEPALADGRWRLEVIAVDAAGNRSAPAVAAFTVATVLPPPPTDPPPATDSPASVPVLTPAPTPRPIATPAPAPRAGQTIVVRPVAGRVLVKRPGSSEFSSLTGTASIPLGSELDTKQGRVILTSEPGDGRALHRALLYGGIFTVTQSGRFVEFALSEDLAPCGAKVRSTKAKKRRLVGDGKGNFRTLGRYGSATVRGTKWLVEDSCTGTLTRVTQGVVSVSQRGRKAVLVRAGRSHLAKPSR